MGAAIADTPALRKSAQKFFRTEKTPEELEWITLLNPLHFRLFVVDLHRALSTSLIQNGNGELLKRTLEEWQATAEVDADPELVKKLRTPRGRKTYLAWEPPK